MFDLPPIIKSLWPLWALFVMALFVRLATEDIIPTLIKRYQTRKKSWEGARWRSDRELITWLRGMRPAEFERYIADLFRRLGYTTEVVGKSHDGGVDVLATKDGVTHYIQCKKYISANVTVGEVRDFYGAIADRLAAGKAYFITTNTFTLEAEEFAKDKPIELIDGFRLVQYLRLAEKRQPPTEVSYAPSPTTASPNACPECGGRLTPRNGPYGEFLGCTNFPKCKYTRNA